MSMGGHQSAARLNDEWLTPPEIVKALGQFDLDPAAPIVRPWDTAAQHFTIQDNGLMQRWRGRVWLNAPYSTLRPWLARMAEHNAGVSLIFARTETEAFSRYVWEAASGVLFIEGRLHFHHVDGTRAKANGGAPSVLCAYGAKELERLAGCGIAGKFIPLILPRWVAVASTPATWREALAELMRERGPVRLDDLYRLLANHAKAQGRKHWREQVRKVLQQGPFQRVAAGTWSLA